MQDRYLANLCVVGNSGKREGGNGGGNERMKRGGGYRYLFSFPT